MYVEKITTFKKIFQKYFKKFNKIHLSTTSRLPFSLKIGYLTILIGCLLIGFTFTNLLFIYNYLNDTTLYAYIITDCEIDEAIITVSDKAPFDGDWRDGRLLYVETKPSLSDLAETCREVRFRFASNRIIRPLGLLFESFEKNERKYLALNSVDDFFFKSFDDDYLKTPTFVYSSQWKEGSTTEIADNVYVGSNEMRTTLMPDLAFFSIDSPYENDEKFNIDFLLWNLVENTDSTDGFSLENVVHMAIPNVSSDKRDFSFAHSENSGSLIYDDARKYEGGITTEKPTTREGHKTRIVFFPRHPLIVEEFVSHRGRERVDVYGFGNEPLYSKYRMRVKAKAATLRDNNDLTIVMQSILLGIGISLLISGGIGLMGKEGR